MVCKFLLPFELSLYFFSSLTRPPCVKCFFRYFGICAGSITDSVSDNFQCGTRTFRGGFLGGSPTGIAKFLNTFSQSKFFLTVGNQAFPDGFSPLSFTLQISPHVSSLSVHFRRSVPAQKLQSKAYIVCSIRQMYANLTRKWFTEWRQVILQEYNAS